MTEPKHNHKAMQLHPVDTRDNPNFCVVNLNVQVDYSYTEWITPDTNR